MQDEELLDAPTGALGWCASPQLNLDQTFGAILGDDEAAFDQLLSAFNAVDQYNVPSHIVPAAVEPEARAATPVGLTKADLKRLRNKEAARKSRAKKTDKRIAAMTERTVAAALEFQRPLLAKRSEIAELTRLKHALIAQLRARTAPEAIVL